MIRERFPIDRSQDADDKAMELVFRTENLVFVLACPKNGIIPDRYLLPEEVEWVVTDDEGLEDLVGILYGAYHLVLRESGEYAVSYENMLPEKGTD